MNNSFSRSLILSVFFFIPFFVQSQSVVGGFVKGLKLGDTATVRIQKSGEVYYFKRIGGITNNADVAYSFPSLSNGKWALSIDAKGYLFPISKVPPWRLMDMKRNCYCNKYVNYEVSLTSHLPKSPSKNLRLPEI